MVRLVSLLPSATEIVDALGLSGDLVGVSFECDQPPGIRERAAVVVGGLDTVGLSPGEIDAAVRARVAAGEDLYTLHAGALAELAPDLVLLDLYLPDRFGLDVLADLVSIGTLVLAEAVMAFVLMVAIFGTAVDERGRAVRIGGFGVGLTLAFNTLAAGAITGAAMNPARAFGPALVSGVWNFHIYYWIGPIIGAVVAALLYDKVLLDRGNSIHVIS